MHPIQQSALLILLAGGVCAAQDTQDEAKHTAPAHQRVKIIEPGTLPRMGTDKNPIAPTEPNISKPHETGLTSGQDWMQVVDTSIGAVAAPSALAEGSFILSRTGRLVPAPNDRLIFVPSPEERLPGEGPTLLLPCATLERLENIWANQPVTLSGEIMTYHDRNALLISDFALGLVPTSTPQRVDNASTKIPETVRPVAPDDEQSMDTDPYSGLDEDPDVVDLLRELDAQDLLAQDTPLDEYRELSIAQRAQPSESSALQLAPPTLAPGIREGALMMRRPARLDRAADGAWIAIFDNDDPSTPEGIELTVLPCSLLMTMEEQSIRFGDSARFIVSGRIYIHNNRGYLLPTFYQRLRTSDIKPWQ